MSTLTISAEPFDSDDGRRLVAALDAGLAELYPPAQRFGPNLKATHLEGPRHLSRGARWRPGGRLWRHPIARHAAEAKRMYVEPDHRGRGVGRALLTSLEAAARQLGAHRLVLETGIHQEAAIALYPRAGFRPIDCWGEYLSSATSICFEKLL